MRDIFDENRDLAVVKRKLQSKVSQNTLIAEGHIKDKEEEEVKKDDDKKVDHPTINIEQMLKDLSLNDCIPKLKEHEIGENNIFFELDDDKLIELLDIQTEGKKYRFKQKIKQVKEKHEKDKAKREIVEDITEVVIAKFELLKKKSTIEY